MFFINVYAVFEFECAECFYPSIPPDVFWNYFLSEKNTRWKNFYFQHFLKFILKNRVREASPLSHPDIFRGAPHPLLQAYSDPTAFLASIWESVTGAKLETVQLRLNCVEETEPSPLNIRTSEGRPTNIYYNGTHLLQRNFRNIYVMYKEFYLQDPTKPGQLRGDLKIVFRLSK